MQYPVLPIDDMHSRHWGLVKEVADYLRQGAVVALDRNHGPPVIFDVKDLDGFVMRTVVDWGQVDQRVRDSWNHPNSTEQGACACAIAAWELLSGNLVVRRAEQPSGADYYVAPPTAPVDDLESQWRLEVSGCDHENAAGVRGRLRDKVNQLERGDSPLPGVAVVVGFRERLILFEYVEEP